MSQSKPEYEYLDEFTELAKQVVSKYQDEFYGIDPDKLRPVAITNKERPAKSQKLWDVKAVPMPIKMDCPYTHYIILWAQDWHIMTRKHKLLLISQILWAIPVDEYGEMNESKVKPFDLKDYYAMQATFGTDWLVKDDVPDILDKKVNWKLPHE